MRSKRHSDLHEIIFACILMASIWLKVLTTFSFRNTVLQAGDATLDAEVENIKSQIEDLRHLRERVGKQFCLRIKPKSHLARRP